MEGLEFHAFSSSSLTAWWIHKPSSRTIRSSCKLASCLRILSNPTSSASLPLMRMIRSGGGCPIWIILICSEAYLKRSASKNVRSWSAGLLGRMNDAALGSLLTPL
jgi:hypothetical protein